MNRFQKTLKLGMAKCIWDLEFDLVYCSRISDCKPQKSCRPTTTDAILQGLSSNGMVENPHLIVRGM